MQTRPRPGPRPQPRALGRAGSSAKTEGSPARPPAPEGPGSLAAPSGPAPPADRSEHFFTCARATLCPCSGRGPRWPCPAPSGPSCRRVLPQSRPGRRGKRLRRTKVPAAASAAPAQRRHSRRGPRLCASPRSGGSSAERPPPVPRIRQSRFP